MSNKLQRTVRRNLDGFVNKKQADVCDPCETKCKNTTFECLDVAGKYYLREVDDCGKQVGDIKPLGTCSVDENGVLYPSDENGNQIIDTSESVTTLTVNAAGDEITYTSEDGTVTTVPFCPVCPIETITTLVANPAGGFTYTNEAGVATTIADASGTAVDNGDNTGTVTFPDGSSCTFLKSVTFPPDMHVTGATFQESADGTMHDLVLTFANGTSINAGPVVDANTFATVVDNGTTGTVTDPQGNVCTFLKAETVTTLVANPAGGFTYTNELGATTVIPPAVSDSLAINPDGSLTHTASDGTVVVVPAPSVSALVESGGVVTHTAGNGAAVSFDICAIVAANCNSPMVINPDESITYTDNAGTVTTIPAVAGETVTSLVLNAAGNEFVYTSEDGTVTTVPFCAVCPVETVTTMEVTGTVVTYTSEDGTVSTFDFCDCADVVTNLVADNDASTLTYTNEEGVAVVVDMCALVANCVPAETVTTLSLNAAGDEITYTSEDGTVTTVPFCAVCPVETVTTLVANPDGGFTYTSEDGTVTPIPASAGETVTTLVPAPDGSYIYTSEDGTVTTIAAPAVFSFTDKAGMAITGGSLLLDDDFAAGAQAAGDVVLAKDATGACKTIPAASPSVFASNGDGTTTHTSGDGTVTSNIQEDIVDGGSNLVAGDGVTINPLLDWDGNVIDVTQAQINTGNNIENVECIDNGKVYTFCDGTEVKSNIGYRRRTLNVGVNNFDDTLGEGLWADTEDCTSITIGPCQQGIRVDDIYTTVLRSTGGTGSIATTTWLSIDGGATYTQMGTNGIDQSFWDNPDDSGERTFHKQEIYQLQPGTYDICRITEIRSNNLDAGSLAQLPNKNTYVWYMDNRCC